MHKIIFNGFQMILELFDLEMHDKLNRVIYSICTCVARVL